MTGPVLRPLFGLLLALLIAATSLTMAAARGQTRIAGEVVICTGAGVTTVAVDADSQPVGPAHLCPDMVLALMVALDQAALDIRCPLGRVAGLVRLDPPAAQSRARAVPRARDPPAAV